MGTDDTTEADLVVIGSGQGGVPLAAAIASRGNRVVLFERGPLGGTCVNVGCTPSKTFLASAHGAGRARAAGAIGVSATLSIDVRAVFERVRRLRDEWRDSVEQKLAKSGVDVVRAQARFCGERTVEGGGRKVRGKVVAIDTGGTASAPPIPGLAGTPYLTNANFFDQTVLPRHLIVIGGGYIGLELGQGARRLGADVTLIHTSDRVLEREEADASAVVLEAIEEDGMLVVLDAKTTRVSHDGATFTVELADGRRIEGDGLLIATGRHPNTTELGLEASGIATTTAGYLKVDDYLQTTCENVFGIGDVAGQPAFTHVSWEDHRRILSTLDGRPRRRDDRVLSYAVFTEPQLARTGMTIDQARAKGIDPRAQTLPLSDVARGVEWNVERGFFRMVVDAANDRIIGATFVGYEAGELIHVIVAHIEAGSTWQVLDRSMHVHPTLAEGLPSLARLFE